MVSKTKIMSALALGLFGGYLFAYNIVIPKKKTVDDYVNCFKNAKVNVAPLEKSESLYDFVVVFDKDKINQEKSKEFLDKVGYSPLRSTLTDKYLIVEINSSKIKNPSYLSQRLHTCFLETIHSTSWSFK